MVEERLQAITAESHADVATAVREAELEKANAFKAELLGQHEEIKSALNRVDSYISERTPQPDPAPEVPAEEVPVG